MSKITLLFIVMMLASANAQEYSGPKCLGTYCLNRKVSDRTVFALMGAQRPSAPNLFCYSNQAKDTYLFFETFDSEPHTIASVLISNFPNCTHMMVHNSSADSTNWKTPEGIGLGSSEADVLKAYGKSASKTRVGKIESQDANSKVATLEQFCRYVIRGFQKGDKTLKIADYDLFYRSENMNDLSAAEFGIHDGKVTWIFLSQNE